MILSLYETLQSDQWHEPIPLLPFHPLSPVSTAIPQLMQQQPSTAPAPPPAPPPVPPAQLMAATGTATVGGAPTPTTTMVPQPPLTNSAQQPTSTNHTHSSFLGVGGMTTFGLANPLQVLQTILPGAQHTASQQTTQLGALPPQPLAYSTLNVCVAGTPTRPTILPASYHMPGISGTTMGPNTGKVLLPGTTTASALGTVMNFYQQQATIAGFQQMSQTRMGVTVPQSILGQSTLQTASTLPQNLLLPLAKRPALDSTYRPMQSSVVSTPLRPPLTQPGHIPLTPTTTPLNQVPITHGPSYLTVPQQVTPTTPAAQLRAQNPLGGGAVTPQLPGQQSLPQQQHHGYSAGGAGWGR